jgi:hypothetical protein
MPLKQFHFPTLEAAWEGMNEYLYLQEKEIKSLGGGNYGTEIVLYDAMITVDKTWISPDFNFGSALGYTSKKWSKLINNYVDLRYLELVKNEVREREAKKAKSYNHTMHFDNSHGSGKDCLISLTFQRRISSDIPTVIYHTRASEATKRMIFDFLLIQRLVEYVYGDGVAVEMVAYIPFVFINVESFLIYMGYKGGKDCKALRIKEPGQFQSRILRRWDDFQEKPIEKITFRVHKRAAIQIKRDADGNLLYKPAKDVFAKDLVINFKPRKVKASEVEKLNEGLLL